VNDVSPSICARTVLAAAEFANQIPTSADDEYKTAARAKALQTLALTASNHATKTRSGPYLKIAPEDQFDCACQMVFKNEKPSTVKGRPGVVLNDRNLRRWRVRLQTIVDGIKQVSPTLDDTAIMAVAKQMWSKGLATQGRPRHLDARIEADLLKLMEGVRETGGVLEPTGVISLAKAVISLDNPGLLKENGGDLDLKPCWARSFLKRIKWKNPKKSKRSPASKKKGSVALDMLAVITDITQKLEIPKEQTVAVSPEPIAVSLEPVALVSEPVAFGPKPVAVSSEPVAISPEPVTVKLAPADSSVDGSQVLRHSCSSAQLETELKEPSAGLPDICRVQVQCRFRKSTDVMTTAVGCDNPECRFCICPKDAVGDNPGFYFCSEPCSRSK